MTGAADWTGRVGDVWAAEWRRTDRSFADLSRHLDAAIRAAAPQHAFRALDIGCGAGGTSLALAAARPDATILGVDLSAGLVEVARERFVAPSTVLPRRQEPRAAGDFLGNPGLPPSREHGVAWGRASDDDGITLPVLPHTREPGAANEALRNPGLPPAREHAGGRATTSSEPEAPRVGEDGSVGPTRCPISELGSRSGQFHFETGDAPTAATAHAPFDLLYSRHGVMFFDDPVAAFTTLRTAAAPGGRLVFSCFADWSDNAFAKAIADALDLPPPTPRAPGPFAFADNCHVADTLTRAGWTAPGGTRVPFTYRAGEGEGGAAVADALEFFQRIGPAAAPLRAATPAERTAMLDRLTDVLRAHRVGNAVDFPALAWIWSATA